MLGNRKKPTTRFHQVYFKAIDEESPEFGLRQSYVILLVFYYLLLILSFILWLTSMIGTQWKRYYINEDYFEPTNTTISEFPRFRGLWLVCLSNPTGTKELVFLKNVAATLQFNSCQNLWIYTSASATTTNILNLRYVTQAMGIIACSLLLLIIIAVSIFFIYWRVRLSICPKVYQTFIFWITFFTFIIFMCQIVLMIVFHQMISYEKSAGTTASNLDVRWSGKAIQATVESYGVMYYMAWLSIFLVAIALMMIICSSSNCLSWVNCSLFCNWCQCCFCKWCCDCFFICCKDCGIFHDHVVECRSDDLDRYGNDIFYTGDTYHERSVFHNHQRYKYMPEVIRHNSHPTTIIKQPSERRVTRVVREFEDNPGFIED